MFNTQIDVAAIMQEIKSKVVPEMPEIPKTPAAAAQSSSNDSEVNRIAEFIQNTRKETHTCINIGYELPVNQNRPGIIRKGISLMYRVIRRATRFITNDQIAVNKNTDACIQALVEREDALSHEFAGEINAVAAQCNDTLAKYNEVSAKANATAKENAELKKMLTQLSNRLDAVEKAAAKSDEKLYEVCGRVDIVEKKQMPEEIISDEMYLAFEQKFRGNEADISNRQSFYVDKYLKDRKYPAGSVAVDLGCGRGEWLYKMRRLGMRAIGVDTNADMVAASVKNGEEAYEGDAIAYLESLEDNSISVVSAFQVIEHLSKGQVAKLVKEAYRVLKPAGVLLLETPNICNVEVGACAFHIDPTHINPVHPDYLQFMAEYEGFTKAEIAYWNQEKVENWLTSVVAQEENGAISSAVVRTMFETMKNLIYASPDYALVAEK